MARRATRRSIAAATLASLTLVLGACGGGSGDNASGGTVKLAFVGPLTGDSANLGVNIRNGAKVAIQEAKDAGVKVELVEYDTQGDPAAASTVKDRYINDDSVVGIIGPTFSGETKAVLPDLQANSLVMVSASATNKDLPTVVPGENVFHRVIPDDDVQGAGVTNYIVKKLAAKKVAYVNDNSDYGKGLAEGTEKTVKAAGVATATTQVIDPKSQDFSAAVTAVKNSGADVVFYGGYYTEAGRLAKQLKDAGVAAQFLSADGALDPGFITAAGSQANGAQLTCPCNLATTDSTDKALADFATKYGTINGGATPGTYSSEGFDAANVMINGIKAGHKDRESLLKYVNSYPSTQGISKTIAFESNGNIKNSSVFFFQVKDNKISLLGSNETLGIS